MNKILKYLRSLFMNKVVINGRTYEVMGNNVSVTNKNGKTILTVNGIVIDDNIEEKEITVKWQGELANLNCTNAEVNGNITGKVDCTSLTCNNIKGDVKATSVDCKNFIGDINALSVN